MYNSTKEEVRKRVLEATFYSATTDMWTSRAKHSYVALTIHYITKLFELKSHLLEVREFDESHTGEIIAQELEETRNLDPKQLAAVTTDNGSNIVLAMKLLEWNHVRCFSHMLQLAVDKVLQQSDVAKALGRCKRLVTHFNHLSRSSDLRHKELALVQSVATSSSTTPTLSFSTAITTSITTTTSSKFSQPKRPKSQLMELIGDIIQSPSVVSDPIEIAHSE